MTSKFQDIDIKELDALIIRVTDACENDLALSNEDLRLLLNALLTLTTLQDKLSDKNITIAKLRKLSGIVASSEKLSKAIGNKSDDNKGKDDKDKEDKKRKKKLKLKNIKKDKPKVDIVKPETVYHPIESLTKGDICPECEIGKLYKYEPSTLFRITGQSPLKSCKHICERLRCNACLAYFTAELPEEVKIDGNTHQRFAYSARTYIAMSKCFMGSPYYRQESFQNLVGVPVTASTAYDQCAFVSDDIYPVFETINRLSSNARHFHIDDTSCRINDQKPIMKPDRKGGKDKLRSGIYCSVLLAELEDHHKIVIFQSSLGHAGELIDEILINRSKERPPPIIMSDALSSNVPTVKIDTILSLCNCHSRRLFFDLLEYYPIEIEYILKEYGRIWHYNAHCRDKKHSKKKRFRIHRMLSLKVMKNIKEYVEELLKAEGIEENSRMGVALRYFINHWDGLSKFCVLEGVEIDNNAVEQMIKIAVRLRKNSLFYKTARGAQVSDVITSMIMTASENGVNAFDYLTQLQQNKDQVKAHPEKWLPWNYLENLS